MVLECEAKEKQEEEEKNKSKDLISMFFTTLLRQTGIQKRKL